MQYTYMLLIAVLESLLFSVEPVKTSEIYKILCNESEKVR